MDGHLTPAQIRGARAMLHWSMDDLAAAARLSLSTIKRVELGELVSNGSYVAVRKALEVEGVRFVRDEEGGLGVHVRCPLARAAR